MFSNLDNQLDFSPISIEDTGTYTFKLEAELVDYKSFVEN